MSTRPLPLVLAAALLGCAASEKEIAAQPVKLDPGPTMAPAAPARVPPAPAFDAKGFAAGLDTPQECEGSARRLRESSPDQAWALLKACVERTRYLRGPFVQLGLLTSGSWDDDLQARADAPLLVTRLIAARGGDVEGDLAALQKSRTPVFSLQAALAQPELYKGRWLVLRGTLGEMKTEAGAQAARIAETSLRGATREYEVGPKSKTEHRSSGSANVDVKTTRYGDASASGRYDTARSTTSSQLARRFENERQATGRTAIGRLARADPFLEPNKEFVFLARFDGARAGAEGEPATAALTVVGYFAPSPLVVE